VYNGITVNQDWITQGNMMNEYHNVSERELFDAMDRALNECRIELGNRNFYAFDRNAKLIRNLLRECRVRIATNKIVDNE
jgi:hypothetical protein